MTIGETTKILFPTKLEKLPMVIREGILINPQMSSDPSVSDSQTNEESFGHSLPASENPARDFTKRKIFCRSVLSELIPEWIGQNKSKLSNLPLERSSQKVLKVQELRE